MFLIYLCDLHKATKVCVQLHLPTNAMYKRSGVIALWNTIALQDPLLFMERKANCDVRSYSD